MNTVSRIPPLPGKAYFAMHHWFFKMYKAGLLFNPDDSPETIVDIETGNSSFSAEECAELNVIIETLFDNHGDAVYDCCLKYAHKSIDYKPDNAEAFA